MVVVLVLRVEASPFVRAQSKPLHHDARHIQVDQPHSSRLERRDEGELMMALILTCVVLKCLCKIKVN